MINKREIINKTKAFAKSTMQSDYTAHDWSHVGRVYKMATSIAKKEKKGNILIVQLASLLHDVKDWKFNKGDSKAGADVSREWLEKLSLPDEDINTICYIVENISYKGKSNKEKMSSIEGMIVQDADRLDAIGAIGVARVFAFGGYKKEEMYNPSVKRKIGLGAKKYLNKKGTTINHFYEKLLFLKDEMHTKTAREIAYKRHEFMENFLDTFYKEWRSES